jgi:geranylgeranyl diphosphate synthase type 3
MSFNSWRRPPFQDIIGDLHNASLMIDDIEDNSKLRRGIPVAHSIFGIPSVINAANYAYFLALEKVHALENPEAMKVRFADWMSFGTSYGCTLVDCELIFWILAFSQVFVGELLNLHRGQGHDILVSRIRHCGRDSIS